MKKSIFTCLVVLVFSTVAFGDFAILTVEELVKNNNLIVTGRLKDVIKTENDEFKISHGILVIEKVNYGNFITFNNQKLKAGDKVSVEWRNSKMMSCRFEFTENENQIWYLNVDKEGKVELLTNNSSSRGAISEFELLEIKKQTQTKGEDKFSKRIKLQNETQEIVSNTEINKNTVKCAFSLENKRKEFHPFLAFLVALASISLYYILYKSKFKIR